MGEPNWRTINRERLEAEIDKLGAKIDAMIGGEKTTRDMNKAMNARQAIATHDALVTVFNCLD